ncbi:MAG: hypothetical protein AAF518_18340 [Spirochaetota bacterium]
MQEEIKEEKTTKKQKIQVKSNIKAGFEWPEWITNLTSPSTSSTTSST